MITTPNGVPMSDVDTRDMREEVAEWIVAKGWNDDRTFGDELILIVSELVEALEAFRSNGFREWDVYQPVLDGVKMPKMTRGQVMALCAETGINSDELLVNTRREGVAPEIAGTFVPSIGYMCQARY